MPIPTAQSRRVVVPFYLGRGGTRELQAVSQTGRREQPVTPLATSDDARREAGCQLRSEEVCVRIRG